MTLMMRMKMGMTGMSITVVEVQMNPSRVRTYQRKRNNKISKTMMTKISNGCSTRAVNLKTNKTKMTMMMTTYSQAMKILIITIRLKLNSKTKKLKLHQANS